MLVRIVMLALTFLTLGAAARAEGFPVTVVHARGETSIPAPPERIVSIGYNDQDFLYALGVAPIGVHEWWGGQPYATWPWAEAARAGAGATPEVMKSPETDFEWVAAQRPDLIIAAYYDLNEADYALLSQIAPVIAAPAGYAPWSAPWQEQLKLIDRATSGATDRAVRIIADLDARTAAVAERYPQLVGQNGIVADLRDGQFTLWDSQSAPSRFLQSFGLAFPADLDRFADAQGWIRLSPEQIDLIDQDVVVIPIDNPSAGKRADIERQPLYDTLSIGSEGRVVWLGETDGVLASALWFQSPLSIGYIVEKLPPLLAAAVDGDPSTQASQ